MGQSTCGSDYSHGGSSDHYDAGVTAAISADAHIGADTSLLDCTYVSTGVDLSVCLDADVGLHSGHCG